MAKTIEDFYVHQTDAARVDNLLISPTYYNFELYGYSVKNDDSGLDVTFRGGGMGHGAGCIIGTLTGKFIDVGSWRSEGYWQELIRWQIRLFNPIWLVDGTASYIAYVNFGLKLSLYESVGNFFLHTPENLTYNSEGLPTFYFRPGNTRWTAIEAPVWKDHYSKTQWRPYFDGIDTGKRDSFYLKGKVNYFPDVDPDYLRYGNPKKYDDLWAANLNWIELTKEFWTPGSIYWVKQGQYVFNGYNTMDYTINPLTGEVYGSYTGYGNPLDQVDYWNKYVPDVPYISEPFTAGQNSVNFRTNIQYYSPTAVTASGLCFSTSINPTIANTKVPFSTVTGEQINAITGLTAGTVYYVRAYATNAAGTTYSAQKMFKTTSSASKVAPEVATATVTDKIETIAKGGGTILNDGGDIVTERGVEVSLVNDFATKTVVPDAQQGSGNFVVEATSLTPAETYYVRAYAKNAVGTGYGPVLSFTAGDETPAATLPIIKTLNATSVIDDEASLNAEYVSNGGDAVSTIGFVWDTLPNPTTAVTTKSVITENLDPGIWSILATSLTAETTYYFRAYATNSVGTTYGEEISFKTAPSGDGENLIVIDSFTNITKSSAIANSRTLSAAPGVTLSRGVCWSVSPYPSYSSLNSAPFSNIDGYRNSTEIRGILPGTTYYVRPYILFDGVYQYGEQGSFTTEATTPIVDEITDMSLPGSGEAYVEGSTITDGGNEVVERGFVYSKYPSPLTTTGTKIVGGTGNQTLYAQLTGLEPSTTYYIRMYSIDTAGNVTYGTQQSFVTLGNRVVAVPGQSVRISHTITKSEFINRVMLIMNEAGIYDGQGNPFSGADQAQIDRYIAGSFVDAWRRCASVMPRAWFKNQSFKNYPLFPNLSDGTGYVVLPEDFYLLTSFKMSGWKKAVYEAFVENERTASIQANTYTRGSTIRPVITSSNKSIDITPINITVVEDDIQIERYIRPGYIIYSPTTDKLYTCPADTYAWRGRYVDTANYSKGNLVITEEYKVYKAYSDNTKGHPSTNYTRWQLMTGTSPVLKQLYVGSDYDYGTEPNIMYKRGDYYIGTSIGMEKLSLELNGINQVLNYYSLNRGLSTHTIEEAIYVPACSPLPDNDDTDLELDQRIIEPLAYLSASTVFTIFEKYEIAKALEQRVIEMFPGFKSIKGNNVTIKQ